MDDHEYPEVIHGEPKMVAILRLARKLASTQAAVLVTGENGTGKEWLARKIHALSPHKNDPFIVVSCRGKALDALDLEVFGRAAETTAGAAGSLAGALRLARKGTVFFDEIDHLPLPLQAKLLRTLQDGEVRPLGSTTSLKVKARVAAATNKKLTSEVMEGRFREDLFYCLNVVPITLPSLKDRPSDIPLLIAHFIEKHAQNEKGRGKRAFSSAAVAKLQMYDWPGNIRQLEKVVQRLLILTDADTIEPRDLPPFIQDAPALKTGVVPAPADVVSRHFEPVPVDEVMASLNLGLPTTQRPGVLTSTPERRLHGIYRRYLGALAHKNVTPTEVAALLRYDLPRVSRVLKFLRSEGLVEISPECPDRRSKPHSLTTRGEEVLGELAAIESTTK